MKKIIIASIFICSFVQAMQITLEEALKNTKTNNLEIKETQWGEEVRNGQLDEAKSGFFPKLEMTGIVAPMYKISGNPNSSDSSYSGWSPYYMLDSQLVFPIFTFGKVKEYKKAATNGIEVAKQETQIKTNEVILQTKEYYYQYQLARTIFGVIKNAKSILEEAILKGDQMMKKKKGSVKKQDILKLKVYYAAAQEKLELAKKGLILAKGAVALQMGLGQTEELEIKDGTIEPVQIDIKSLNDYLKYAKEARPEYKMANYGLNAKLSLMNAEKANHYPNLFIGTKFDYRKAESVEDQKSAFAYDDYNDSRPGIGLGFQWKLDYGTTAAKVRQAKAEYMKIVEKAKYAEIAIPMDIKRRYYELIEAKTNMENHSPAMEAAKEWMIIEVTNYSIGINEAKDLLEAVGADAIQKYNYYNAVLNYNMAIARLSVAVGREISNLKY